MKRLNPAAISSLREALASVVWYKEDLRSFLTIACGDEAQPLIAQLNWNKSKLQIASDLLDTMGRNQSKYQDSLIQLMLAVCDYSDFSHLRRLEDGAEKEKRALDAVAAVRQQTSSYREQIEEREKAEKRRQTLKARGEADRRFRGKLSELRSKYLELASNPSVTPQQRGLLLEPFLRDLFMLFDLDPRGSFRTEVDQIDGAFSFQSWDFLLSAKWQQEPVGIEALDAFKGKVMTRLENTLGLYISISGFSKTAVERHSGAQPVIILMDGTDLMAVLDDRIRLNSLLLRKRRHASQTGDVFLPSTEIL